ncbi:MAG: hypothetical protein RR854_00260 [Muribaculaceae bacterium]
MALKKLFIVLECANDQEEQAAQEVLKQISNMRIFDAKKMITYYPILKSRERSIRELFGLVSSGGVKSLLSMKGISLIKSLT